MKRLFAARCDARGRLQERFRTCREAKKVAYEWENYWPVNQGGPAWAREKEDR
jgi:hypothetical protein